MTQSQSGIAIGLSQLCQHNFEHTVYCKLFEVEKFRGFRELIGDRETFPAKHFRPSF